MLVSFSCTDFAIAMVLPPRFTRPLHASDNSQASVLAASIYGEKFVVAVVKTLATYPVHAPRRFARLFEHHARQQRGDGRRGGGNHCMHWLRGCGSNVLAIDTAKCGTLRAAQWLPGMARAPLVEPSLIRLLKSAISEGCLAGAVCGIAVLFMTPWVRELISGQDELALSIILYLFACAQIGVATSLTILLVPHPVSRRE